MLCCIIYASYIWCLFCAWHTQSTDCNAQPYVHVYEYKYTSIQTGQYQSRVEINRQNNTYGTTIMDTVSGFYQPKQPWLKHLGWTSISIPPDTKTPFSLTSETLCTYYIYFLYMKAYAEHYTKRKYKAYTRMSCIFVFLQEKQTGIVKKRFPVFYRKQAEPHMHRNHWIQ